MCGILGIATRSSDPNAVTPESFRSALARIRHRGPDGSGIYQDRNLWLGHARLSILDLSAAGSQPMKTADERFVITYNGEIYNFRELAVERQLENLHSRSDTEVLLRLFASLGVASLPSFNGMFAFAIYDRLSRRIWLVRDRMGIKPLYFRIDEDGLAFASEIKGIPALTATKSICNAAALHEWLYYGNTLGGRTLCSGIRQLLPGHYLELDLDSFEHSIREYHSFRRRSPEAPGRSSFDGAQRARADGATQICRLLEHAVRRQLVSDVPVGVFLSGGVDSSAITAFASRHYQGRLATYSVGFDFAGDTDELPRARRIAELFGTDHHEINIGGGDVPAIIEKMVYHHDAPFADAANIPLYMMAEKISSHTKVVLQGDGGDEVFGGYRRYATLRYYRFLASLARSIQGLHRLTPRSPLYYRIQRYLHALSAPDVATTMALLLTQEDRFSRPCDVFAPAMADRIGKFDPFVRFREVQPWFADRDIGNQMSLTDICIELPDLFLEKVDRSTMAASLEVRVPFLDHDLVDYVTGLSGWSKMPFGKKKWLLKKALRGIIPNDVLYGPKIGFTVPYGAWLQSSLKTMFFDHLSTFVRSNPGVLNAEHIGGLYARTAQGRQNHSFMLWKILNFVIWANLFDIQFTT
jgi:asparagine synthase (glutamine-hydrolysing)